MLKVFGNQHWLWAPVNRVSSLGEITQLVPLFMALGSLLSRCTGQRGMELFFMLVIEFAGGVNMNILQCSSTFWRDFCSESDF